GLRGTNMPPPATPARIQERVVKRILGVSVVIVVTAGVAMYLFREPLLETAADFLTRDMFVAADEDGFDPGLPVGAVFPDIRASHQARVVTSVAEYLGPNGLVFFANRSVDW